MAGNAPSDANSADDYFLEIESHFANRRGTAFVFSAKDWALIKSWRDDGIPLALVLEAIDDCFEKRKESGRRGKMISSLSYCRHAVKEIWDERKELQAGASGTMAESDPAENLARLAGELESSAAAATAPIRDLLLRAAMTLRSPRQASSARSIEEQLIEMEERLISDLLSALGEQERSQLEAEVGQQLRGYQIADEKMKKKTREANLRRLVRERFAIPRLSLFT